MNLNKAFASTAVGALLLTGPLYLPSCFAAASPTDLIVAQDAAGQASIAKKIGTIKAISGSAIILTPESGAEIAVTVQPNARLLRIAPGEKDLKSATPVQLQDLQVGDRVRVRGQASADATSLAALEVIVISHSELEARHEQERQDWQKRGMGGPVKSVDPATGTLTISVTSLAGKKDVAVHTSKTTVFRRYAPDSVKFDDAKPSAIAEVQPGDQLRARGDKNTDGTELTADEIVTGAFRNVAGVVNTVDASAGSISVQDLLSKRAVTVKITAESQLRKLPPEMAQRIAARLKGAMPPGMPGAGGVSTSASATSGSVPAAGGGQQSGPPQSAAGAGTAGSGAGGWSGGGRQGGAPDFQQMLSRMPTVALADLHKGDAVLIVTTEGNATSGGTAITLLSGVEPILQVAPNGSQAMMLAPWSLGGAPGGDSGQ